MGQYDEMRRVAMLTPGEAAYEGDPELNRRDLRREIAATNDPRVRAVLQLEMDRVNGATVPPAVATSMRDGFPELRSGQPTGGSAPPPAGTGLGAFLARQGVGGDPAAPPAAPARRGASLSAFLDSMPEAPPAPPPPAGLARRAADLGLSLAQGAVQVPQAAVGLADLVTGGNVGKALENEGGMFGFRPDQANAYLESLKSNEQQAANKNVADASKGEPGDDQALTAKVGRVAVAAMKNPSVVAHTIVQSLPSMMAGGVLGRGALWLGLSSVEKAAILALPKAEQAAAIVAASRVGAGVAGGVGEGLTTMGQQAEQIRTDPANPSGLLTPSQVALAAGSGAVTGLIGVGSGTLAKKLGIENAENLLVGAHADPVAKTGLVRRVIGGAVTEGLLEELPQSVQEQVAQNMALGKPWDDGVDQQAVLGVLSGSAMGAGAQAFHKPGDALRADAQPSTGTLADAANLGVQVNASVADANPTPAPAPAPSPVPPETAAALMEHANKRAAELDTKAKGTKDEKGADGKVTPGDPAQFLTPEEKQERDFLKEHGGDAEALARVYEPVPPPAATTRSGQMPVDTEAAIARIEQQGQRDVAGLRDFAAAPKPAPAVGLPVSQPVVDDPHEPPKPGDILTAKGQPFKERAAALRALKAQSDPTQFAIASVTGGYVVRPGAPPTVDATLAHFQEPTRAPQAPIVPPAPATIDAAAHEAAPSPQNDRPEPTQGQKEAGNYKLGHDTINGLNISFENPAGSVRKGVDRDGKAWENTLQHHYGYLKGTVGNDKDHVDVFVKPETPRDFAGPVFVIDQVHPDTGKFDEHKVMLGFHDIDEAQAAYHSNYADDWMGLHSITPMPFDEFKAWVHDGPKTAPLMPIKVRTDEQDTKAPAKQPAAEAAPVASNADQPGGEVSADAAAEPAGPAVAGHAALEPPGVEAAAAKPTAPAKIADFGEQIHGARKDYATSLKDAMDVDVAAEPLSKSWPEPDYQKLLDGGADPFIVGFVRAARDEVPTKPQSSWKLSGWVDQVKLLRGAANKMLSGEIDKATVYSALASNRLAELRAQVGGRAGLYQAIGHDRSLKGVTLQQHHYSLYRGEKDVSKWVVEQKAKATSFSNWPRELAAADTRDEALAQFKAKLATVDLGAKAKGQPQYVIYRKRNVDGAFVGKKIGREYIDLKKLDDIPAARSYLQENTDDLDRLLAKYRETPLERREENQPRVGDDHRNGAPVTPEIFADTFGFRGVQFGNYVEQGRRQSDLNEAFDGLMDLSAVLGIPPRALSLNGRLGLAFGARGKGGKGAPAAHFEPGHTVINLTKGGGPGSLAHEWWHGLDNYFARQGGDPAGFVTGGARADKLRTEMQAAFKTVQAATQAPTLRQRSAALDKRRSKPYWNTPLELSARAFESYVIAKLQDQGASNDYLANVVDESVWNITEAARAQFFGTRDEKSYPYPGAAELPAVRAAFDNFFKTVEARPDDAGNVALASRTGKGESAALRALAENDDLFALPKSTASRIEAITADNDASIKVRAHPSAGLSRYALTMPDGTVGTIFVREPSPYGPHSYGSTFNQDNELTAAQTKRPGENAASIGPEVEDVWVDASKLTGKGYGARLYNIAQTFAHNTGRIFIGDPAGLSDDAMVRRPEQMLSSALKFGTTEHLAPHPRQISGDAKLGVPPLKWVYGDHEGNVRRLIDLNLAVQDNAGNTAITFDPANGQFRDSTGQPIDRAGIDLLGQAGLLGRGNGAGGRTTARAAVLRALLRDEGGAAQGRNGQRDGLLARLAGDLRRGESGTSGIFYSRDEHAAGGLNPDDLRAAVAKIAAQWANGPKGGVTVVDSTEKLPAAMLRSAQSSDPDGEARAWFEPKSEAVYLIADKLPTLADAQFALFHEVYGHYGMRSLLGDDYGSEMMRLRTANQNIAAEASMWFARYGQQEVADRIARGMDPLAAQREVRLLSTEEALADRAGADQPLKGWKHVMAKIQKALRALGLHEVANWLETRTEAETLAFLNAARKRVQEAAPVAATSAAPVAAVASRPLAGALNDAMNSAKEVKLPAGYILGDLFDTSGKVSWWHKTVGTMHNLAERSPEFKRVYDSVQGFINDVSSYATEAADLAPKILPKLETWKDIAKSPLSAADTKAIGAPIFEGTLTWARDEKGRPVKVAELVDRAQSMTSDAKSKELLRGGHISENVLKMWQGLPIDQFENMVAAKYERDVLKAGVVWTDDELRSLFKLSDDQIGLYREFRKATDRSLTNLAISDMLRFGGDDVAGLRDRALATGDVDKAAVLLRDALYDRADSDPARKGVLNDTGDRMIDKADRANDLMRRGYAPLSRFGSYTLDVVHEGQRVYFGLFESKAERSMMARKMVNEFKGAQVQQGTVSEEAHKLFAGVSPETLELFGDMLGLEAQGSDESSKAFQTYIKLARSNRSAMKRLIERKGIAGFSEDAGRVLAGFVYSNARQTASNLHMGEMSEAAAEIPQGKGELKDAAVRLTDYIKNPREEAQAIRGVMFAQYLGGSIASAMVNMTQPFAVTFPYLSQWGGVTKSAQRMAAAVKDANKKTTGDKALDAALKHAEDEGIVSPQEVHQLMAQAQGRAALKSGDGTLAGDAAAKASNVLSKVSLAWGKVFGIAEQYNRRVTFIAAYRTAVAEGIADPPKFAAKAVADTQFTYNKGNKPQWARGAIGGTLFTFKQYSVNYVELLNRMWTQGGPEGKKAALLALGVMFLMSGADGLPFADDANDVIDGAMQRMGYNFSTKAAKREFFANLFGEGGGRVVEKGLSGLPGVPIDVAGRLGLGNLIPGTGLLTKKTDHTSDVTELLGPAGDLATRAAQAGGKLLAGDVGGSLTSIAPTAARNMIKAYDMANTGMYRDQGGSKVIDVDGYDALAKAIGFQPNDVARAQEANAQKQRLKSLYQMKQVELNAAMANAIFSGDADARADVFAARDRWNDNNPDLRIGVNMPAALRRVREMRMDKATRIEKSSPRAIRAQVRGELAEGTQ